MTAPPLTSSPDRATAAAKSPLPPGIELEVFFDGDCPLCRREIAMLRRRDRRGVIRFTNLAAAEFDPAPLGLTHDELMAEIRGRLPDGTILTGMEVFRRLYAAAGFGFLARLTRLPIVRPLFDAAYRIFARNRLRLTGRCDAACRVR
ncbi:MAG: DUF393 domain-containing protein [Planctomyces sp.]|nr:DUF393 domain-containing protein [Planctomyces sp.]